MGLENLNSGLRVMEKALNYVGYIPVIGTVSGSFRFTYGKIEAITGLAAAALFLVGSVFAGDHSRADLLERKAAKSFEYSQHGMLNMGRAVLEFFPFVSLVTCFPYDCLGRKFIRYTNSY